MQARVNYLKNENVSGTSTKSGTPKEYDLNFAHFLDTETYDKFRLMVSKEEMKSLEQHTGKVGILSLGIDPRTEKPYFIGFKVAAA
jgi:hypothetical protein